MENHVSLDLMEFIERNILPRYTEFDKAHSMQHVTGVIRRSLEIARKTGADLNMTYTVAAYHDLGLSGPRAIHHLTSGKILAADVRLKRWFSAEQIRIMKEAVEDHRASASHTPRSLYGKIVAEADRDIDALKIVKRTVQYGMKHYKELDKEAHWTRTQAHLNEKYGEGGYLKLWIPESPNAARLTELRQLLADKERLRIVFDQFYEAETSQRFR